MGVDALLHGELSAHQHMGNTVRTPSGFQKVLIGTQLLGVKNRNICNIPLRDASSVSEVKNVCRNRGEMTHQILDRKSVV